MAPPRIEVRDLGKSYGEVAALVDVSLAAGAGAVLGVLGHNGAGKTTLVDVLATRTPPTSGSATVCGWDVVKSGRQVRRHIGMTGQFVALDETISGHENLVLLARLLGAGKKAAVERAAELLAAFDLEDAANRKPGTYSGGMRRRLDLAASLIGHPEVLFLDEPTTGLDPVSRTEVWDLVERLAAGGTTVVLTTQDLREADRLATEIVVLAAGKVVVSGTPEALKANVGQRTATVAFADAATARYATSRLVAAGLAPKLDDERGVCTVPLSAAGDIATLVRTLDTLGIDIKDITVIEPTLDDVYLAMHKAGWRGA